MMKSKGVLQTIYDATHIDARPYTLMPGHTGAGWGRSQFSEPLIHHPHPTHDTSFLPQTIKVLLTEEEDGDHGFPSAVKKLE